MKPPDREELEVKVHDLEEELEQLRQDKKVLARKATLYKDLFDNANDLIQSVRPDGSFIFVNRTWRKTLGYSDDEVGSLTLADVIHPDSRSHCLELFGRLMNGEKVAAAEATFVSKDGDPVIVEGSINCKFRNGRPVATRSIFRNITDRKIAEKALKEMEDRFTQLRDGVKEYAIFMLDPDGYIVCWNKGAERITGYTENDILGHHVSSCYHDGNSSQVAWDEKLQQVMAEGRLEETGLYRHQDGSSFWANVILSPVYDEQGALTGFANVTRDITEQRKTEKRLRHSHAELNQIFDSAPYGIRVVDLDFNVLRVNETCLKMFGKEREKTAGKKCFEQCGGPLCYTPVCPLERIVNGEERVEFEMVKENQYGVKVPCVLTATPYLDAEGNLIGIVEHIKDITELKRVERAIQKSLEEKEILLREVHHRVKNNMQVISSLLYVQSGLFKDERVKTQFVEAQARIRSMAQAHDNLYRSRDLSNVDFESYARTLSSDRWKAYGIDPGRIACDLRIADVEMPIDRAIPCGLLINELITNALKYAFPDGRSGTVTISLDKCDQGELELTVSDNGIGIGQEYSPDSSKTFGMMLVSVLADQLSGLLTLDRSSGTCFILRFPENGQQGPVDS